MDFGILAVSITLRFHRALGWGHPMKIKAGPDAGRLSPAQLTFKIGARVRPSELGRQRFRRPSDKPATVVGYSRISSAVKLIFDGNKSPTSLHASYLVADPE
jgi:hypothetical protein